MKTKRYKKIPGKSFRVGEAVTFYESDIPTNEMIKISNSKQVVDYLRENDYYNKLNINSQEISYLICLNRRNKIKAIEELSRGGISETIIDPIRVFSAALNQMSKGIILVHNHPSGSLSPSSSDKKFTSDTKQSAELLNMTLLDSIIISDTGYFSFADEGIL